MIFLGLQCEASIDECLSNPCEGEGTEACIDLDNKYECKCKAGYTGDHCEVRVQKILKITRNNCFNNRLKYFRQISMNVNPNHVSIPAFVSMASTDLLADVSPAGLENIVKRTFHSATLILAKTTPNVSTSSKTISAFVLLAPMESSVKRLPTAVLENLA